MTGTSARSWLAILSVAVAVASASSRAVRTKREIHPRPSVLLISVDALGAQWLRAFDANAAPLPALDAWAARTVRFSRTISTASWTLPAHASLLTGLYPDRHGATLPQRGLAEGVTTLADVLRRSGFETVAFTDGNYLDPRFGLNRGFSSYDRHGAILWPRIRLPRFGRPNPIHRDRVFDRALAYLSARSAEEGPYFLFLHTQVVHDYFMLEAPQAERNLSCLLGEASCSAVEWAQLRLLYQSALRILDDAFARLLEVVRRTGSTTYVVLTSDHGEGFDFARGRLHHAGRLHADVLWVPLLIEGPGIPPHVTGEAVSLVDVAPTILEFVGTAIPQGIDGVSLLPAVGGLPAKERSVFAFEYAFEWQQGNRQVVERASPTPVAVAMVHENKWLIRSRQGADEVYDMQSDPSQRAPLAGPVTLEMSRSIARRFVPSVVGEKIIPSRSLSEQLRALGYVR